jgi:hypothetical protein
MKLTRKYTDEQLSTFVEKRRQLVESDRNYFMGDLRNYITHYGVPPLGWTIRLKDEGFNDCDYFLSADKLQQWKEWRAQSRKFITSNGSQINLLHVVKEHGQQVDEAFIILLKQFPALHTEVIDAVNKLMKRRNDILSGKIRL